MKILAVEFSSNLRSAAVFDSDVIGASSETDPRGATGMRLVDRALRAASLGPKSIELIVVGLGPGSYTGVRAAIAIAQGWQLGLGTPAMGVSSMEVLAAEAQRAHLTGELVFAIDAQRKEFYRAAYAVSAEGIRESSALQIVSRESLENVIYGPNAASFFTHGVNLYPGAAALATLANARQNFTDAERLEPIYLRPTSFVKAAPPVSPSKE